MAVLLWLAVMALGFAVAVVASRRAVDRAGELSAGTRLPPFIVGMTLVAIGTDLPEIANSIVASVAGHGDINVGDSVGSAATQSTLVLGLLPLVGGAFVVGRARVVRIGGVTVGALLAGAALMSDGALSRFDAIFLVAAWIGGSVFTWSALPAGAQPTMVVPARHRWRAAGAALLALGFVGAGATLAVWALSRAAAELVVSEYLLAFFVASVGTSLPELVVDVTAIRRGQRDLAVGDALGSSFVDSTLSIAVGPLIAPVAVSSGLVIRGSLVAAGAIGLVLALLSLRRRHDGLSGTALILIYVLFYAVMFGL